MIKIAELEQACCTPLLDEVITAPDAEVLAGAFKILSDPGRLRLLSLIATQPGREACVCDLVTPMGLSQPTISHHLKVLHEAGLLAREKRGNWVFYRAVPGQLARLRDALSVSA